MRPLTQRLNARGKAGRIVDIDQQPGDRSRADGGLEAPARDFCQEAVDRLVAFHAENGIVIAAHAGIRHVGRATGQHARVGRRRVRMGADHGARSTVEKQPQRLLFARCLGVEINQDRIGAAFQRASRQFGVESAKRTIEVGQEHAPHRIDDQHLGATLGFE